MISGLLHLPPHPRPLSPSLALPRTTSELRLWIGTPVSASPSGQGFLTRWQLGSWGWEHPEREGARQKPHDPSWPRLRGQTLTTSTAFSAAVTKIFSGPKVGNVPSQWGNVYIALQKNKNETWYEYGRLHFTRTSVYMPQHFYNANIRPSCICVIRHSWLSCTFFWNAQELCKENIWA